MRRHLASYSGSLAPSIHLVGRLVKGGRASFGGAAGIRTPVVPPCKGGAIPLGDRPVGFRGGPFWARTRDLSLIRTAL